jgi:hypothetical protein
MFSMAHQSEHTSAFSLWRSAVHLALIACATIMLLMRPYLVEAVRADEYAAGWLLMGPSLFLGLFLFSIALDFLDRSRAKLKVSDYIRLLFAVFIIGLSFPASLREYKARMIPEPLRLSLIEKYSHNPDARLRALALLASSRHNLADPALKGLIHKGLLDKDPLVRQAALLVIEENLGIQFKSDADGINQAQVLIQDVSSQALLIKKGSP